MAGFSGWDPGRPPTIYDGGATVPSWMDSGSFGQLQVLLLQSEGDATLTGKKKLNPFIVGKTLKDLVGEIEGATTEANGNHYVLRVRNPEQVKKLLELKQLCDSSPVSVDVHPRLNKRRCVISCRETQNMTEEELLNWMKDEGVVAVKRITRMENGNRVNTPSTIITLEGTVVPNHINVGPLRIKTRIYIPDPTICYMCYKYGHTKSRCKSTAICRNCSKAHDLTGDCCEAPFCLHCQGKHGPTSRACPKYAMEKEIVRLRFTKGISHNEALKQIQAGGGSYAAVSKVQSRPEVASGTNQLKEKEELIENLMATIQKLNDRITELEDKQKRKKDKKRAKRAQGKADESGSEMETDSSVKVAAGAHSPQVIGPSSQVSGTSSVSGAQKTHKRHYTTEILPPTVKKTPTNPNPDLTKMQSSMYTLTMNPPSTQTNNGQRNKHITQSSSL